MIEKVVQIFCSDDNISINKDLEFWLSKTPEERISAVEYLRRQYDGNTTRFQRILRIVKQK